MLGDEGRSRLRSTPVFVIHERIAAAARQQGLDNVIVTASGDAGLLAALLEKFAP